MKYCIDTSSLLEAWTRRYPIENFPGFWSRLADLFAQQVLISSEEVFRETEKKEDGLAKWLKNHRAAFLALTSDIQIQATQILGNHPRLVDQRPGKGLADPWVIATAAVTGTAVVTEEDTGNAAKPKIPFVCQTLQIRSLRIVTLIQEQKWAFA